MRGFIVGFVGYNIPPRFFIIKESRHSRARGNLSIFNLQSPRTLRGNNKNINHHNVKYQRWNTANY